MPTWAVIVIMLGIGGSGLVAIIVLAGGKAKFKERVQSVVANNKMLRKIRKGQNKPLPTDQNDIDDLMRDS